MTSLSLGGQSWALTTLYLSGPDMRSIIHEKPVTIPIHYQAATRYKDRSSHSRRIENALISLRVSEPLTRNPSNSSIVL